MNTNYLKTQIFSISSIGVAWGLFIFSSFNYSNEYWFEVLLYSRIFLVALAIAILLYMKISESNYERFDTNYLTIGLFLQSMHGFLESSSSVEFHSFTGVIFILASLSYRGDIKIWIKKYMPFQYLCLLIPIFFKDKAMISSLGNIMDKFSLVIAGGFIGTVIAKINIDKQHALSKILQLKEKLINEKNIQISYEKKLSQMAKQVAHDIRSPLASLLMASNDLSDLPETTRVMIRGSTQRIQDIANNLLTKNKGKNEDESKTRAELLSSCIEEIISEKRMHFRSKLELDIHGDLDNSYGVFVKIDPTEFKRILSNLINNAAEATDEGKGIITIHINEAADNKAKIVVEDNGKGISKEIIDELGREGASFGKEKHQSSGSGLGLYHAKTTMESWGGELKIESEVGVGTKIMLVLPKENPPHWFVRSIEIKPKTTVIVVDDDEGIHHTWDIKFRDLLSQIFHLSSPNDFSTWMKERSGDYSDILYLFDCELISHKKTGLDLIDEYKLGKNAILVTSHYEEKNIRDRCKILGVKLIPKMIAGFVPINVKCPDDDMFNAVYIEDDLLLRMCWDNMAKKSGIKLLILTSPKDLEKHESKFFKEDTSFYIDNHLGVDELKGTEVVKMLHEKGYKKLYLTTGSNAEDLPNMPWVQVVGKECPWGK